MASFFIVIFCFSFSFILHIAAHRIIRLRSIAAYLAGAVLLYVFSRRGLLALPCSSGFLYLLVSVTAILFYVGISLGTETPSSIILSSFKRNKRQTFKDLTALFTDKGLIVNRIDDLTQSKLITRHERAFILTGRGKIMWRVMETYRRIFHRLVTE